MQIPSDGTGQGPGATSRERLLVQLRRRGAARVADLAADLGLTAMTVRHHLRRLQAQGLATASRQPERRTAGRPALLYRLTAAGDEALPKGYDRFARLLLDELIESDGDGSTARAGNGDDGILSRLAERAAAPHHERLDGRSGKERIAAVATILRDESGFTELRPGPAGTEILEPNCIFRALLRPGDDSICEFHTRYVGHLLGQPVRLASCQHHGDDLCCFRVSGEE